MKTITLFFSIMLLSMGIEAQNVPSYVPTDSLIAWFPFNGNSLDQSGNGNNGTNYSATLCPDRFGNSNSAYLFNGTNSYIGTNFNGPSGNSPRTINCWAKYNNLVNVCDEDMFMVSYGANSSSCSQAGGNFGIDINYYQNSLPKLGLDAVCVGKWQDPAYSSIDSNWHMFTVTFDPVNGANFMAPILYVDGEELTDLIVYNGSTLINTLMLSTLTIGRGSYSSCFRYYSGRIDDVGIWNRALTDCEVKSLFHSVSSSDTIQTCQSFTTTNGNNYTVSGIYFDTLVSVSGCDSLIQIDLTILEPSFDTLSISGCAYVINPSNGDTIFSSGQYIDTLINTSGCDSIVTLDAIVFNSTTYTDIITSCDSLTWIDGLTYYSNNNSAVFTTVNSVGCDSIITLNLTINQSTSYTDIQDACIEYTWIDGNTYYENIDSATFVLTNQNGCDSLIILNLTVNKVDTTVISSPPSLEAIASDATYQWFNCQTLELIENANEKVFIAKENGDYAVIITQNFCADTSSCFNISNVGVMNLYRHQVSIYPNPGSEQLHIESTGNFEYRIFNSVGSIVLKGVGFGSEKIDLANIANGYYSIEVIGANYNESRSIIVSK